MKELNRVVKHVLKNVAAISFPELDNSSLRVIGFSNAAFANNYDHSTKSGFVIFFADMKNRTAPIHY